MTRPSLLRKLFVFVAVSALAITTALSQVPAPDELAKASATLSEIENNFGRATLVGDDVETALTLSGELARAAGLCIVSVRDESVRIKTLIGEPAKGDVDPSAAAVEGADSNARIGELDAMLLACQDLALRADSAISKLQAQKDQRRAQRLETRGRHVIGTLMGASSADANWEAVTRPVARIFALPRAPAPLDWFLVIGLALFGGWIGLRLKSYPGQTAPLAPALLAFTGALAGLTFAYVAALPQFVALGWRLLAIGCLIVLSANLPRPAAEPDAPRFGWRIGGFLVVSAFTYHLGLTFANALPVPEVEVVRLVVIGALFATAVPATKHIRFLILFEKIWRPVRGIFVIGFAIALIAELTGYRAFAGFVLAGFGGTLTGIILYSLVERGGEAAISSFNSGDAAWVAGFKRSLGLGPRAPVPGIFWLRLFFEILIFAGFVLWVMSAWGLSDAGRGLALTYAIDGFELWGITLVPIRLIGGLLLFGILLLVSRRVRDMAERKWTSELDIDPGGREALVTLIGYAGVIISILTGLSWAGFSFDNLALVAGALSVGIGFGLQNVVSNFVSGLILLFERPIRAGDWIQVGGTEGVVKKIRVRATEIQQFDRTEVIVPNADFITNSVTNFTLHNKMGRLFLPVGVAYGSDTELVRDVLFRVASSHPDVLMGSAIAPEPIISFTAFGDSALNFEIRAYLRDVGKRLVVTSDLHFAIDKAFRENGIEMPFPQRDIHIRDWPAMPEKTPPK